MPCHRTYSWMEKYGTHSFTYVSNGKKNIFTRIRISRFGKDSFSETLKIVNKLNPDSIDWTKFRYMVFDIPTHKGIYSERYSALGTFYFISFYFVSLFYSV